MKLCFRLLSFDVRTVAVDRTVLLSRVSTVVQTILICDVGKLLQLGHYVLEFIATVI